MLQYFDYCSRGQNFDDGFAKNFSVFGISYIISQIIHHSNCNFFEGNKLNFILKGIGLIIEIIHYLYP